MRKTIDLKQVSFLILLFFISSCAGSKQGRVIQEKPPGFLGQVVENTTSRYNAYYNSEQLYSKSMISGEDGYKDNFDKLLPPSVQDAIAQNGGASGNMSQIIQKTATMIEKKPYAKWVDDQFLLNGIAQYIKGDYEMAERIFRYTSTEYKFGVNNDRVSVRQKQRGITEAEKRKQEAKEKIKQQEAERKRLEEEQQQEVDERKSKAEKKKKAKQVLSRDEQFKAKKKAKEEGRDTSTEEIVREIKKRNDLEVDDIEVKELSDQDREIIATAPTLQNNQDGSKESKIGHHLAAKDAILWLAKTYITTEDFIAAQAVLTDINEDPYFPERLNTEYYLTYADMHIRLNNFAKATEYVQLAIDSSPRREKGRLYYLLGQLFTDLNELELAEQAFSTVEKYHPYYDMIYEAKKQNFEQALEAGKFDNPDVITTLKKMTRDSKNDEFRDQVYYYLGRAYQIQEYPDLALESFEKSLEYDNNNSTQKVRTFLALGDSYYAKDDFKDAQPAFASALELMKPDELEYRTTELMATSLETINTNLDIIHIQDSLLQLAALSQDEQLKIVTKKANKELRKKFQDKLNADLDSFGNNSDQLNSINDDNSNRSVDNSFYFYDMQQSIIGYSKFKEVWGNRPNVDGWRRSSFINRSAGRNNQVKETNDEGDEVLLEEDLITKYLLEIPNTPEQKQEAYKKINDAYLIVGQQFIDQLGDYTLGKKYLALLFDTPDNTSYIPQANQLLKAANQLENNKLPEEDLSAEGTDEEKADQEITDLYTQTYQVYEQGNYEKALELVSKAQKFQNNNFGDKFAFIGAMSKGYLEGGDTLKKELNQFAKKYPQSPLKERALEIIK